MRLRGRRSAADEEASDGADAAERLVLRARVGRSGVAAWGNCVSTL